MAYRAFPPNGHRYDKQCGCSACTAYENRLTDSVREDESFFQARRKTGVWSATPGYDVNVINRATKIQG